MFWNLTVTLKLVLERFNKVFREILFAIYCLQPSQPAASLSFVPNRNQKSIKNLHF